jgi:hypothetical protein
MKKFDNFKDLKNSDTTPSKDGKIKGEECYKKFIELLRENVIDTNKDMKNIKNIKSKQ